MIKFIPLFVFLTFICSINLTGQVINIEKQRKDQDKNFYGKLSVSYQYEKSKNTIWQTSNDIDLYYKLNRHLLMSFTGWNFISASNQKLQNKGYEHFRYNFMIDSIFSVEAFAQYQFNDLRKIRYRTLAGAGGRMSLFAGDSLKWNTGLSMMYEERFFTYDSVGQFHWRINIYTNLNWDLAKNVNLSGIVYFQPSVDDFNNQNISGEARLKIQLIHKLSFFFNAMLTYETEPPVGAANLYSVVKNGIRWDF